MAYGLNSLSRVRIHLLVLYADSGQLTSSLELDTRFCSLSTSWESFIPLLF